ncbi:rCG52951 [Rattus norvegicus]|uniref:RCG52951 n=1 Tax=Rattus norvegicus TaxID=10116 RepID=A6IQU5_RAT|nr:rCG52951 [Rattus norvegicus]
MPTAASIQFIPEKTCSREWVSNGSGSEVLPPLESRRGGSHFGSVCPLTHYSLCLTVRQRFPLVLSHRPIEELPEDLLWERICFSCVRVCRKGGVCLTLYSFTEPYEGT